MTTTAPPTTAEPTVRPAVQTLRYAASDARREVEYLNSDIELQQEKLEMLVARRNRAAAKAADVEALLAEVDR